MLSISRSVPTLGRNFSRSSLARIGYNFYDQYALAVQEIWVKKLLMCVDALFMRRTTARTP